MYKFKTTFSGRTICVFAQVEKSNTHLANIDTMANRIYTTTEGYDLIGTNCFKSNHKLQDIHDTTGTDADCFNDYAFYKAGSSFTQKFDKCVDFSKDELSNIIKMCNRQFEF